jgi:hypothetical protein
VRISAIPQQFLLRPTTTQQQPGPMRGQNRNQAMAAASAVEHDQFMTKSHFDQQSQRVDAYWKAHMSDKGNSASNG